MSKLTLELQPLTQENFSLYGDVIECQGHDAIEVNNGMGQRFNDLATVDTETDGGRTLISLFTSQRYSLPHRVAFVERHPLGSQAFMPLSADRFLVVVAPPGDQLNPTKLQAFMSNGQQGISYHKGTWHHVLLTPFAEMSFLCIDRGGKGNNCEEQWFDEMMQPVVHHEE